MYQDYKNLDLYETAHRLILQVYKVTKKFPKDELFGMVSQMRRAAVSVLANLVEGYGRKNIKEKIQFYHISVGSLNELEYYINLSRDLDYISEKESKELVDLHLSTARLFSGYIRGLKRNSPSYQLPATSYQNGQTLVETIVALFVLTMGITSGLSLAIYSFGGSTDISRRVIAAGLAREGIESIRRMRDSNWLAGSLTDCTGGQFCYANWLAGSYDISGSPGGVSGRINFDPGSFGNKLSFAQVPPSPPPDYYQLYQQPGGGLNHSSLGATATDFYRKLRIIYQDVSSPYSATNPLVLVRSSVWWHGKNCPPIVDLINLQDTSCKIISEEYLTNWKNY